MTAQERLDYVAPGQIVAIPRAEYDELLRAKKLADAVRAMPVWGVLKSYPGRFSYHVPGPWDADTEGTTPDEAMGLEEVKDG